MTVGSILRLDHDTITIGNDALQLRFDRANRQRAKLLAGQAVADLFLPSSCNANGRPDFSHHISPPALHQSAAGVTVEVTSSSSIWQNKKYSFHCSEDRLDYTLTVSGTGDIDTCELFQGFIGRAHTAGAGKPWVQTDHEDGHYGHMRSEAFFGYLFNPEPNGLRKQYFQPNESSTIGVRSDKSYCRGSWFFTPGPFCYVLETSAGQWLATGLAVRPGENNFVEYTYQGGNGFGLSLSYEGKVHVNGTWESPHVVFLLADDEYSAVEKYCDHIRAMGYVPQKQTLAFDWWREPIFCGWGAQRGLTLGEANDRNTPHNATQANYERFIAQLEQRGLFPGTIIIDDKWQDTYGDPAPDPNKWPDMPGFIARQHAAGRRVLLWLKAWNAEGVPSAECLLNEADQPVGVNPANPAYERRLRRAIRRLLTEIGADGFKIDFTHQMPRDHRGWRDGAPWGAELLRRLLWIIHDEAKAAKEDALIIAHTANPYFADIVDMVRLNDIAIVDAHSGYAESMVHRQKVARAVSPAWLIDTDNWPSPTLAAWLEYMRRQPELGVPSLYYIDAIDESAEAISEEHSREIAEIWAVYRRKLSGQ